MTRKRPRPLPGNAIGLVVLDSGAVGRLALADPVASAVVEDLSRRGWTVCIPAVTLAEVIAGHPRTDVAVERLVNRVANTIDCDEVLAKAAGGLRARLGRHGKVVPSGIDAIVAAVAARHPPAIVLTTDEGDLGRLLGSTPSARVLRV